MLEGYLRSGIYLLVDGVVLCLFLLIFYQKVFGRFKAVFAYLLTLFLIDAVVRSYALRHFGVRSPEYFYTYWITDAVLTLGAFLLMCAFFRRACVLEQKMWSFVRLFLLIVFVLVIGVSALTLSRHYDHLFSRFIVEFEQNLYFTCLVLNTLLFVLIQRSEQADEDLNLLVCGLGIQFAGPAASFALKTLTPELGFSEAVIDFLMPFCTLGMLMIWTYTVVRKPLPARVAAPGEMVPAKVAG